MFDMKTIVACGLLLLAGCGGGGVASTALGSGPFGANIYAPLPLGPTTTFLTDGDVFAVQNATIGVVERVDLTVGDETFTFDVDLAPGEVFLFPDVLPGRLFVRLYRADGTQYARWFDYVPGVSDGVRVTRGDWDFDAWATPQMGPI